MNKITELPTVAFDKKLCELVIIDQTKLPNETVLLHIHTLKETFDAIRSLAVRGAPAIGVAAAVGIYAACEHFKNDDVKSFKKEFHEAKEYLSSSRPTAVNLFWALDRMEGIINLNPDLSVSELKRLLHDEALKILNEDVEVCRKLGEYGLTLLKDGDGILTHCNAGQLAAVRYGTALSPMHVGAEQGMKFRVYCDETRPLLQGSRLSAYEMVLAGMETTVLCDNMAASLMKKGLINAVFTGCDRVAANGDAANKIGTMNAAILARHFNIPFYIFAPSSTIDMKCKTGEDITIEYRNPDEVSELWFEKRMVPEGVNIFNPAFDVTEASLITAIVTEYGIIRPPYQFSFEKIFRMKREV
jgi:methylthioribose-1-phosphate isomerase